MLKIEADTLELAYTRAALEFGCSITELDTEVISKESSGLFGMFKKPAVLMVAGRKTDAAPAKKEHSIDIEPRIKYEPPIEREPRIKYEPPIVKEKIEDRPPLAATAKHEPKAEINRAETSRAEIKAEISKAEKERDRYEKPMLKPSASDRLIHGAFSDNEPAKEFRREMAKEFDKEQLSRQSFRAANIQPEIEKFEPIHNEPKPVPVYSAEEVRKVCAEIQTILRGLFDNTGYKIDTIDITLFDDRTLKVFFNGEDAALLIGRDGYRYKALSYILFNWINPTYGYLLRLEIAEFLQNQEEMIVRYLEPIIEQIKETGKGQTRILDGVLVQIALKELRSRFPDKYVGIKTAQDGEGKYVVVNDFTRKYN